MVRVFPNWALMILEEEQREMQLQRSNDGLRFLSVDKAERRHIKGQRLWGRPYPSKADCIPAHKEPVEVPRNPQNHYKHSFSFSPFFLLVCICALMRFFFLQGNGKPRK